MTRGEELREQLEATAREQRRVEGWICCWVLASALLYVVVAIWLVWGAR